MEGRQLLAKTAAPAQGNQLIEGDLGEVSGHLQRDLEVEAILATPVVVAGFEQVKQPVQVVVIRDEGPLIGERPLTGEAHGEQVGKASRHSDPPLILGRKTVAQAKAVQPLQTRLGGAEAVMVGDRTPARDQLLVAKHLVADEVGGDKAGNLIFDLGGDGGKEGWCRPLGQQIALLAQGIEQGGEAALLADGEDEGEPLQIDKSKLEPEFIPYFHAGVVDIGLHRIVSVQAGGQGAGSGIYARLPPCGKHCVGKYAVAWPVGAGAKLLI